MQGHLDVESPHAHLDKDTPRLNEGVAGLYADLSITCFDNNIDTTDTSISNVQLLLAAALRVNDSALALVQLGRAEGVCSGILLGNSRRDSIMSIPITQGASQARATAVASRPMVPAPKTATTWLGRIWARV